MLQDNPVPQFSHLVTALANSHPDLSYIHFVEPRVNGNLDKYVPPEENVDFARKIWKKTGRPFFVAGGYTPQNALEHMSKPGHENDVVVFGRWFISNVSQSLCFLTNLSTYYYDFDSPIFQGGSKKAYRSMHTIGTPFMVLVLRQATRTTHLHHNCI